MLPQSSSALEILPLQPIPACHCAVRPEKRSAQHHCPAFPSATWQPRSKAKRVQAADMPAFDASQQVPGQARGSPPGVSCSGSVERHSAQQQPDDTARHALCWVICGVSGSGKSTVGKLLADRLACPFYDGDDYHPQANIGLGTGGHARAAYSADKMRSGQALTDGDRWPWLERLAGLLWDHAQAETRCVVACSALKRSYREVLSGFRQGAEHSSHIAFVLLKPSLEDLQQRVAARAARGGHFMPISLLRSQLEALEPDASALEFDAMSPPEIVEAITAKTRAGKPS